MFVLQAPHELPQTATVLPSPEWGNGKGLEATVDIQIAIDGTPHPIVHDSEEHRLQYAWILTRPKALELKAFIDAFAGELWRITTHEDEVWIVRLETETIDFSALNRCEDQAVTLEFTGIRYG